MDDTKQLLERWQNLWQKIGGKSEPEPYFEELVFYYNQEPRAYHNLEHIADCLAQFDGITQEAMNPPALEFALWLHDVIYNPQATDNEAQSAVWASDILVEGKVQRNFIAQIKALIMATQHKEVTDDPDEQLICDIDLSILGRPPAEFGVYEDKIRAEYAWLPEDVYSQGRIKVLESFLLRPRLYQLDYFYDKYEHQAHQNLQQAILRLYESVT